MRSRPSLSRDRIHQALAHERAFVAAGRAIGRRRRLVGQPEMADARDRPARDRGRAACAAVRSGTRGAMGAHIAALVVKEFVVDAEDAAVRIDRGARVVALLARMIGGDQVLAPVLDPFHRPAEPQRRDADQHVLGIELAADAEAAADMALEQVHASRARARACGASCRGSGAAPWRRRAAPARRGRRRSARSRRAFPSARRNAGRSRGRARRPHARRGTRRRHRRKTFSHDRRLGRAAVLELAGRIAGVEHDRQFLDLDRDQVGGVLGEVGIVGKHRRDRLADIAHPLARQEGLAVGRQPLDPGQPEIDRRHVGDVVAGPDRDDARQRQRRGGVDRRRSGHAHARERTTRMCSCARKTTSAANRPRPRHQRPVLEARDRAADDAHVTPARWEARRAARRGCAAASPEIRRSTRRTATARR